MPGDLSAAEARRVALAAQGFDRPRPRRRAGAPELRRTIRQLGLLQIDFVNVLVPAHYLVPFSRLGPYDRRLLDEVVYGGREFTEQWAHEASIVPVETWPLLRHRMEVHRAHPRGFDSFMEKNAAYVERVLAEVRDRGPLGADDLPDPEGASRRIPGSWIGTVPRAVLEAHFGRGVLAVAERRSNFARTFDLAERRLPSDHYRREATREQSQRELLLMAARSHGVATAADLADYYRMPVRHSREHLAGMVAAGDLREVRVEGWREVAYLHPRAAVPSRIEAAAVLAPFDPVVWFRRRTARLFGFDYRFEIFVPREKRRWGPYVLPFLLGDQLVARVDVKADRPRRRLRVLAAYLEAGVRPGKAAEALARELETLAYWLGLESVACERRGGLARALAGALRS